MKAKRREGRIGFLPTKIILLTDRLYVSLLSSYGGREASLKQQQIEQGLSAEVQGESSKLLGDVQAKADRVAEKGKELAGEAKTKAVEMKEKVGR